MIENPAQNLTPPPDVPAVPQTPFCGHLRSKKFFMLDVIPSNSAQYLDDSNYCWCFRTSQVVGPDGSQAAPDQCTPGRPCYKSALEE